MNIKLIEKTRILDELKQLDALKNKYARLTVFNGDFDVMELSGSIIWMTEGYKKYCALKHKALMVKLKAVDARIKHLDKDFWKG
jgi:hypothetical protein